jgi:hypothetical protein
MEKLLIEPTMREQMGIEGRRVAEERFSLIAAAQIFLNTYDKVLSKEHKSESAVTNCLSDTLVDTFGSSS